MQPAEGQLPGCLETHWRCATAVSCHNTYSDSEPTSAASPVLLLTSPVCEAHAVQGKGQPLSRHNAVLNVKFKTCVAAQVKSHSTA